MNDLPPVKRGPGRPRKGLTARTERYLPPRTSRPKVASKGVPMPAPLPAGQFPEDDSKLWYFSSMAARMGEQFIQGDTREWFREHDFKVVIGRHYPDHPRWASQNGKGYLRDKTRNLAIVSEIHMLARLHVGKPGLPSWAYGALEVKQARASTAYKFAKALHESFDRHGPEALKMMAIRQPGDFSKMVMKYVDRELVDPLPPADELDPDKLAALVVALAEEVSRRTQDRMREAKFVEHAPLALPDMNTEAFMAENAIRQKDGAGASSVGRGVNKADELFDGLRKLAPGGPADYQKPLDDDDYDPTDLF